jgi:hypothetical protein
MAITFEAANFSRSSVMASTPRSRGASALGGNCPAPPGRKQRPNRPQPAAAAIAKPIIDHANCPL